MVKGVKVELFGSNMTMKEQINNDLTVKFGDCVAGWISMLLTSGEFTLTVQMSHLLDPLPEMLAWLEAMAIGVQECGFRVDKEEGTFFDKKGAFFTFAASRQLCAIHKYRAYTILNVTPPYGAQVLQVTLPTYDLVGIFYRAFREFAESTAYVRGQWEYLTLEQIAHEQSGMTASVWIDSVIALEPRQLQKALWRLDPDIVVGTTIFRDNVGTEAELMELTGKTKDEVRGLPCYYPLPPELWGPYAKEGDQARREYLQECLSEPLHASWRGTPWRKMRSLLIENWLRSETSAPYLYWQKWLT